jgi:hypothetical protein
VRLWISFVRFLGRALLYVSSYFEYPYSKLLTYGLKFYTFEDEVDDEPEITKLLTATSFSYDDFMEYPKAIAKRVTNEDEEFRETVELYFCSKQCLALYEAKTFHLPIQIYNEYRSSHDHLMRALISKDSADRTKHIKSMYGHVQRAFLDAAKLSCAALSDRINKTHRRFGKKATYRAAGGVYAEVIEKMLRKAESALLEAKRKEYTLGGNSADNASVHKSYIEAICGFMAAYEYQRERLAALGLGLAINTFSVVNKLVIALIASAITYAFRHDIESWNKLASDFLNKYL